VRSRSAEATIRQVKPKDLPQVCGVERESFGADAYPPSYLIALSRLCRETFLVADVQGKVVGYAAVVVERDNVGHLVSIAVRRDYRRRKIGSALMSKLVKLLDKMRVSKVLLEVRESNTSAINMYRKLGFNVSGEVDHYYPDGEKAIVMVRELRRSPS
jgi:ribosomal-protein-alanine N-acetyltransferase